MLLHKAEVQTRSPNPTTPLHTIVPSLLPPCSQLKCDLTSATASHTCVTSPPHLKSDPPPRLTKMVTPPPTHLKCDLTSAITRAFKSSLLSLGRCSKICALPRLLVMMITQFLNDTV